MQLNKFFLGRWLTWPLAFSVGIHGSVIAALLYVSVEQMRIQPEIEDAPIAVTMVNIDTFAAPQPAAAEPQAEPEPEPEPIDEAPPEPEVLPEPVPVPIPEPVKPKPKPVKKEVKKPEVKNRMLKRQLHRRMTSLLNQMSQHWFLLMHRLNQHQKHRCRACQHLLGQKP